jgi:acyl-CoA reductase-like NAD-dependent aldehyde dehydrogenase
MPDKGKRPLKARGDFVDGRFVKPRKGRDVLVSWDPGDPSVVVGEFPLGEGVAEEALAAARAALPAWSALDAASREQALQRLRAELRNRSEELAGLISLEAGKPPWEARGEVQAMTFALDAVLGPGLAALRPTASPPKRSRPLVRPVGTVVVLPPASQPALLLHADAISAMAAGCTVVAKPSELAPAVGQLYAEVVAEADLPRGVFNLVQGGPVLGAELARSPLADGVLFAGREPSARAVLAAAEEGGPGRLVRVMCTGHAGALVLDDADLDEAACSVAIGGCMSAGQRCTSTKRVLVDRRVADRFAERLAALLERLAVGHPSEPGTFMGPLASPEIVELYVAELHRLEAAGAVELVAGAPLTSRRRGALVSPALVQLEPDRLADLCDREPPGPILALAVCDGLEEGMALLGRSPFGISTSVFGRDRKDLDRAAALCEAPLCLLNLPTTHLLASLPFVPRGRSGNGVPCGVLTPRSCTRPGAVVEAESPFDATHLPPGLRS